MDPTRFRAALAAGVPVVIDGGLATQLEARGHDLSDRLWSARLLVEAPEAVTDAHLAFYRAGARLATTASYQATFEGFAALGLDHAASAGLLRRSVELAAGARRLAEAEDAALGRPAVVRFVAASVGPYGAMLADGSEYRGRYGLTVAALRDFHRERLAVLAGTDADVLAVETIPEVEEVAAVAELLDQLDGAAAWISVTCADGARLRSGAPVEEAAAAAAGHPSVLALGVNCTAPEHAEEVAGRLHVASGLPVVVYPNSGEGWDAVNRRWTGSVATRIDAPAAHRWIAAGALLVGGCCRVTPDQVAAIDAGLRASTPIGPAGSQ